MELRNQVHFPIKNSLSLTSWIVSFPELCKHLLAPLLWVQVSHLCWLTGLWAPTTGNWKVTIQAKQKFGMIQERRKENPQTKSCVCVHMCVWGNTPTQNVKGRPGLITPLARPVFVSLATSKCWDSTSGLGCPQCPSLLWQVGPSCFVERTQFIIMPLRWETFSVKWAPAPADLCIYLSAYPPTHLPSTSLPKLSIYPSNHTPSIHPRPTQHSFISLAFHCALSSLPCRDALSPR